MQFITPKLKYGYNPIAIYRIDFSTGHFYIGSSKHVKTRFSNWKTSIKKNKCTNQFIKDVLNRVGIVTFTILEEVNQINRFEKETFYIEKHKDNIFLLNLRLDATTNSIIKELPKRLRKEKLVKNKKRPANFVQVYQYSMQGDLIKIHNTIVDAAKSMSVQVKTMQSHLKASTYMSGVKGFIFRKKFLSKTELLKQKRYS